MTTTQANYLSNKELDSELVIGLVCAVGTESRQVVELLQERLGRAGYHVEVVKVSRDVIPQLVEVEDCGTDRFERYSHLMDAGNKCRELGDETHGPDDAILALGVATVISARRRQLLQLQAPEADLDTKGTDAAIESALEPSPRTAFIVDSLKRPEEVEKLRIVYPSGFVLVGVHSEEERRRKHLIDDQGMSEEQVNELLQRDSEETKSKHGQRVNATFHLADFFVRLTNDRNRLRFEIQRIVELWFGNPFITPTFDEHAMFFAFSAALRSADLSRQVGAVITRDSQLLSTGANECPKSGGGLYWPSQDIDKDYVDPAGGVGCARDIAKGRDYTREDGDANRAEQLRIIKRAVAVAREQQADIDEELIVRVLQGCGIDDLTEFGRVVHAEMEAMLSCARNGISTVGATLYSTTFPCHNCAKHIVAAGIQRVVYVEPYPKSKALSHHDDSIVATGEATRENTDKVTFEPFVGVGPRRFFDLFSMNLGSSYPLIRKEKDTGKQKTWNIDMAQLRIQMKPVSYLELELLACEDFGKKLKLSSEKK